MRTHYWLDNSIWVGMRRGVRIVAVLLALFETWRVGILWGGSFHPTDVFWATMALAALFAIIGGWQGGHDERE